MIQTHNPPLLCTSCDISLPINLYNLTEFPPTNINFASTEAELHSHCHVDDALVPLRTMTRLQANREIG